MERENTTTEEREKGPKGNQKVSYPTACVCWPHSLFIKVIAEIVALTNVVHETGVIVGKGGIWSGGTSAQVGAGRVEICTILHKQGGATERINSNPENVPE